MASAATVTATYTGEVSEASDTFNLLGGTSLLGETITVSYVFDVEVGVRTTSDTSDSVKTEYADTGTLTPLKSASATFGGRTYTINGSTKDFFATLESGYSSETQLLDSNALIFSASLTNEMTPTRLDVPFSLIPINGPNTGFVGFFSSTGSASVSFAVTAINVTVAGSEAPLPAGPLPAAAGSSSPEWESSASRCRSLRMAGS